MASYQNTIPSANVMSAERKDFIPDEIMNDQRIGPYRIYKGLIKKSHQPLTTCDLVVSKLIIQHRQNVMRNGRCDRGHNHDLLYVAARLATEFNLRKDTLLMELVGDFYDCELSFDRLFSGVLNTPSFRRDFGTRMASIRVLKFLLAAANRSRTWFSYNGQSLAIPNIPLRSGESPLAATHIAGGRLVRDILIKYGAIPPLPKGEEYDSEDDSE